MSTTSNDSVTLSKEDLAALVAQSVADALASAKAQESSRDADFERMGNAVAAGLTKSQRPKKSYGTYTAERNKGRLKLTRMCFQNGFHLSDENLSNKEIQLLNGITHSGRYIDRLVQVVMRENGSEQEVDIRYSCKTVDQRNTAASLFKSLTDLLEQITAVQDIERAETERLEEQKTATRRKFGDTKAYREAVANATEKQGAAR